MSGHLPRPPLSQIPRDVLTAADYERLAADFLPTTTWAYIQGGSGQEYTYQANMLAFRRYGIYPRVLQDCRTGSTQLRLLGHDFAHPFLLAPVGWQQLVHPEGELATAHGAAATDTCLILSTLATVDLETLAVSTSAPKWFQLYVQPQREVTIDLIRRAEAAGYRALVVTLDTPIQPTSLRAMYAGFSMPSTLKAANLVSYAAPPTRHLPSQASFIFQGLMADAPNWEDMAWLLQQTRLPIVVKGVSHPEDARRLQALGVAGLIISNHGGRALDDAPAALDMLPAIRAVVGCDYPLLMDGGIRSGHDAFKALALGANAVLMGRPQLHALAVAGALGVAHLLKLLRTELELCMALSGCPDVSSIQRSALWLKDRGMPLC